MPDRERADSSIVMMPVWSEDAARQAALCQAYYRQVYQEAFPRLDEAEQPEDWLPLMRPDPVPGKPQVFILLACEALSDAAEPAVLGGVVFELYRNTGDWLMTYIAVRRSRRGAGIARRLFDEAVLAIGAHSPNPNWQLYAEAENPTRFAHADRALAYGRLPLLSKLGMRRLPLAYTQPALAATKGQLTDLMLLVWARADAAPPEPARLAAFLREFYTALDQPDAEALHVMEATLAKMPVIFPRALPRTPARYDATLGRADAITLRMTFLAPYIGDQAAEAAPGDIPLDRVRPRAGNESGKQCWDLLSSGFESFHADIVIQYASASSLPIILQCQPFRDEPLEQPGACAPSSVQLVFPRNLRTSWEGALMTIPVSAWGEAEWVLTARMIDSIALFESGYIAYSCAFVLGADNDENPAINAAAMLALMAITQTAGRVSGKPVRASIDGAAPLPIHEFLKARLNNLAMLAERGDCTAFLALANASDPALGAALRRGLLGMTFRDTAAPARSINTKASVSLEVIGAERLTQIVQYASEADERRAPVNAFTKRLAGLTQNVLDFERQDAIEIHDSLAGGFLLGQDLSFAHRDQAMRFSRSSRAYMEALAVVGGEPYWLLVDFVLSHNAKLLLDLNEETRKDQGAKGLTDLMRSMLTRQVSLNTEAGRREARQRLERTQERRIRLSHYIPNLFRYPTERALFEQFARARGLQLQREYFLGLEETMEKMVREIAVLEAGFAEAAERAAETARQIDDRKRNNLLVAIGVVQATGVFAAFAAVFAAFASVNAGDLASFGTEVTSELGLNTVDADVQKLTTDILHRSLPTMTGEAWPLIVALGLIAASFSFIGAVGLIVVLRRLGWLWFAAISAFTAIVIPAVLAFGIWVVTRTAATPVLVIVLLACVTSGLVPGMLHLLWRSGAPAPPTAGPAPRPRSGRAS